MHMTPVDFIKEEAERLQKEVRERTLGYVLTALGLVAGLAWNDAIKSAIQVLFPLESESVLAQFIYAILITVAIVIIATYLTRLFRKPENEDTKRP